MRADVLATQRLRVMSGPHSDYQASVALYRTERKLRERLLKHGTGDIRHRLQPAQATLAWIASPGDRT